MMRDGRVLIVRLSENATMKELETLGLKKEGRSKYALLHEAIVMNLRIIDALARL